MGRKLDALLGRGFKTSKFKTVVNLAISRLAVLKNQRQLRCSQARSDVVQFLNVGHHERALLRVEHVIKEDNMLDAFVMIESYCNLLIERIVLIANSKECPNELKEAISGLIFAASRCGEFPELQEIRYLFTSRYGKDFAARAVELRNNCGVNPKIIQKFSTRQPSFESRMKLLNEIASENGITLKLQEESFVITEEVKVDVHYKQDEPTLAPPAKLESSKHGDEAYDLTEDIDKDEQFSESMKTRRKYRDVASAAQAAFESAAYAAAAARAAVELSRAKPEDKDPDDPSSPLDKIHPAESSSSDSEDDGQAKSYRESKKKAELVRSISASSSGSVEGSLNDYNMSTKQKTGGFGYDASGDEQQSEEETVFDESDGEKKKEQNEFGRKKFSTTFTEKDLSDLDASTKQMPLRSQDHLHKHLYTNQEMMGSRNEDDPMAYSSRGRTILEGKNNLYSKEQVSGSRMNVGGKHVSVRTRRA